MDSSAEDAGCGDADSHAQLRVRPGTRPASAGRLQTWIAALCVAVLAAAPFVRSLDHPFLAWDDDVNFFSEPLARTFSAEGLKWMWSSFHVGHYAPLTWMSCALDFELAPQDAARQMHRTNLALHGATAAALFGAVLALLRLAGAAGARPLIAAAFGALLWAVHPLRVESVAWLTERRDVLSGLFYALTLLAWLAAQRPGARRAAWLAASVASFAAALLSKVSGVGLPLVMLALDAWPLRRLEHGGWRAMLVEKAPYFVLAAAASALGVAGQRASTEVLANLDELGLAQRVSIAAHAMCFYGLKTLFPAALGPLYEAPQAIRVTELRFAGSVLLAAALAVASFALRRRSSLFAAWWTTLLAFALLLAPVSGLAHAGFQLAADRYTYLPSFALAGLIAAALAGGSAQLRFAAATMAAVALGAATWKQTGYWSDTRTLFERAVRLDPRSYLAHHKLGVLAHKSGDHQRALEHYAAALGVRPERGFSHVRYDRSLTHLALGDVVHARADLEAAIADEPLHLPAHDVLTDLDRAERRLASAVGRLERARAARPAGSVALGIRLAKGLLEFERNEAALSLALELQALAPRDPLGFSLAGAALLYLGRFAEAEAPLARTLELDPSPAAHFNLGVCHERLGRQREARALYEQTLQLDPSHAPARAKLGRP